MKQYTDFYTMCEELEKIGKHFDKDSMKKLTYRDLFLACIGNAGKAICLDKPFGTTADEIQEERLDAVDKYSLEEIVADNHVWEIVDDEHMWHDAIKRRVGTETFKMWTAPKWRILVLFMHQLRGDWSEGTSSPYFEGIKSIIPDVEKEGLVPQSWINDVKKSCERFVEEVDGRAFRGAYDELFGEILTPRQKIQYLMPIEGTEE